MTDAPVADQLTPEQIRRAKQLLGTTPVVALPHHGMARIEPQTADDLLDYIESMRDSLTKYIGQTMTMEAEAQKTSALFGALGELMSRAQTEHTRRIA